MNIREARLVMPLAKRELVHARLRRALAMAFGGYTLTNGFGGWINDKGTLVEETVMTYDIAMPDDSAAKRTKLAEIACHYGAILKQKEVYVRYPNGEVDILTVEAGDRQASPGANVGTGERQAYPGEGKSQTALATAKAERTLGTKRLPQAGEIWKTASGGKAAITGQATIMDGGWYCSLLDIGSYSGVAAGFNYVVNLDGKYNRGGDNHPLDLISFVSSF